MCGITVIEYRYITQQWTHTLLIITYLLIYTCIYGAIIAIIKYRTASIELYWCNSIASYLNVWTENMFLIAVGLLLDEWLYQYVRSLISHPRLQTYTHCVKDAVTVELIAPNPYQRTNSKVSENPIIYKDYHIIASK